MLILRTQDNQHLAIIYLCTLILLSTTYSHALQINHIETIDLSELIEGSPICLTDRFLEEYFILTANPASVYRFNSSDSLISQISLENYGIYEPTDFVCRGLNSLLIADPFENKLIDLNFKYLEAVQIIKGEAVAPVSICKLSRGTIYFLRRNEPGIWTIDRSMNLHKYLQLKLSDTEEIPQIRYHANTQSITVAQDSTVFIHSTINNTNQKFVIPHGSQITRIESYQSGVIILGNGIYYYDIDKRTHETLLTANELKEIQANPSNDLMVLGENTLYILSAPNQSLHKFRIISD